MCDSPSIRFQTTMISIAIRQRTVALKFAIIGFLAISPVALCFDILFSSGLSSQHSSGDQKVLQGLYVEPSPSSAKNVVQVPLQRRFIQFNGRFYFMQAKLGSSEQSLELIVDSGSTDTWVYGTEYCEDQSSNAGFQCCTSGRQPPFRQKKFAR